MLNKPILTKDIQEFIHNKNNTYFKGIIINEDEDGLPEMNGQWIDGFYSETPGEIITYIYNYPDIYEIDVNTLSQFTGLTFKSGQALFANDIFQDDKGELYRVYAVPGGFAISLPQFASTFNGLEPWPLQPLADAQTISWFESCAEYIGNIFDNPELIIIKK